MQVFPAFLLSLLFWEGETLPSAVNQSITLHIKSLLGVQNPLHRQVGKQQAQGPRLLRVLGSCIKIKLLIWYICAGGPGPACARSLFGASVSGSSEGSRLADSVGLPMETLSSSDFSIFLPLFYNTHWATSIAWVCVCASFPIDCLLEPLRRQRYWVPASKHNGVSLILSGISSCPQNVSQLRAVIGGPFSFL